MICCRRFGYAKLCNPFILCQTRAGDAAGDERTGAKCIFLGNMIADMCRDKHYTHFWNDATYDKLVRRPDLDWFLQKYGDALQEPYVRGYYAHLLLDYNFLDLYWDRHFRFYNAQKQPEVLYDAVTFVEVLEQQQMYDRQEFSLRDGIMVITTG